MWFNFVPLVVRLLQGHLKGSTPWYSLVNGWQQHDWISPPGFYTKVVITWGDENSGGDSLDVWDEVSAGVVDLCHTSGAFAARKANGSVVSCAQLLESPH